MNSRTPILVSVVAAIVLLGMLFALRARVQKEIKDPSATPRIVAIEETSGNGRSRASGLSRITRISAEQKPRTTLATKINRLQRGETTEDFDAQKFRAFGDAALTGFVMGEKGGIEGAKVQLYENDPMTKNPPLREEVTDKRGSFTLEKLNDSDMHYIFVVRADGYAPDVNRITLSPGSTQRFVRLHHGVALQGTVRDATTSQPISGATVYYPTPSDTIYGLLGSVVTGPAGGFQFDLVRQSVVNTLAHKDGYHEVIKKLKAPAADAEIPMTPGGSTVRGVTVSGISEELEGGARVVIKSGGFSASTMSGDDGAFEFRDLPSGDFKIFAVKGMPSEIQKFGLADREVVDDIKIVLPSPLFVSGKVIHAYENRPLPGVRVFYTGPAGRKSVTSDDNGQFAFETFALGQYQVEVHEKGYLPYIDKRPTGSVELLTRKIASGVASDDLTIRLKPVPSISGIVRMQVRGNHLRPVFGTNVAVAYLQGTNYERVMTQTGPDGKFFVNLPQNQRGNAKVIVRGRGGIAVASTRIPTRKPIEMVIKPDAAMSYLDLSDKSPLSGVRVGSSYFFPDNRPPDRSIRLPGAETITNGRGMFFMPLGEKQKVELTFFLPDGQIISKIYSTDKMKRRGAVFVYDPVAPDILTDVEEPGDKNNGSDKNGQQNRHGNNRGGSSKGKDNNRKG